MENSAIEELWNIVLWFVLVKITAAGNMTSAFWKHSDWRSAYPMSYWECKMGQFPMGEVFGAWS